MLDTRHLFSVACWTVGLASVAGSLGSAPEQMAKRDNAPKVDFNRDVRPLLAKHCWTCHGTDGDARQAGLRLDTAAGLHSKRPGGQAVVPGDLAASRLWARLNPSVPALQMPPPNSTVEPMNAAEKEVIRRWIVEGAEVRGHWAFDLPRKHSEPPVSQPTWTRNFVDRFVLARLDAEGLSPEPEADAATLLRRASLSLTGLPPSPEELQTLRADSRPGRYERAVDRLLASPRYGEHQARFWLDAVRYGDTHGLHLDNERSIWPFRDWVVRAFNQNIGYDQFITWQLAGDLLPDATTEQRIATGYVRMNPTTSEGGAIEAEVLAKNTFDRVDTTSTVMMGVTLACARCHDHKYDPLSQRDYYGLYAFFNSTRDTPLDGNALLHGPVIKAPTPGEERTLRTWDAELRGLEDKANPSAVSAWAAQQEQVRPKVGAWQIAGPFAGATFDAAFDTPFAPEPGGPGGAVEWRGATLGDNVPLAGIVGRENAAAYLRTSLGSPSAREAVLRLGSDDGVAVWLNGALVHKNKAMRALAPGADTVRLPLKAGENEILLKIVNAGGADGVAASFGDPLAARVSAVLERARKNEAKPGDPRELAAAFLEAGPESPEASQYRRVLRDRRGLDASLPQTLVAEELPMPRSTYVMKRGEYDHLGAPVTRAVPNVFGWLPKNAPVNRLGFARWLTDAKNPLTSRVYVNRVWQEHFGTGIVASSEDFGSRGEYPSHPELLDTLAVWFRESGWDVKALHRLLVTSAAFRQSAGASDEKRTQDPENRLISRGPRYRLDAEVVRDQALYAGGLLVETQGGRGVRPYQPPGIWEEVAYTSSNTARYLQDKGDALYRRSIYVFWKRTSPPPTLMLFDAPMREACVVRRSRTNTPLQALAGLNSPAFFEASRAMAERVFKAKSTDPQRAALAFEIATSRAPKPGELGVLLRSLASQRAIYRFDPSAAADLLKVGESPRDTTIDPIEHAAWTMLCNLLLNLDETLTMH